MSSVSSRILLPVSTPAAFRVIADLNTIIRLSPFFTLKHIEPTPGRDAQKGDRYSLMLEYYSNRMIGTHAVEIDRLERDRLISYTISSSVIKKILYELEPVGKEVRLTQTFELDLMNETLIKGTQDELHVWLSNVGRYLKLSEAGSPLKRVQKWFMDRIWLRLSVSERNIAMIMVKISILELVLLLVLVLIWNIWTRI
jgi:hypothetical protein